MNKAKLNYLVDFLLFISFFITAATGLVLFFFIPSGVRQGGYQTFIGIMKATWTDTHNYAGLAMIILSLIHLILHWNWIVCMTKNLFEKKDDCKIN